MLQVLPMVDTLYESAFHIFNLRGAKTMVYDYQLVPMKYRTDSITIDGKQERITPDMALRQINTLRSFGEPSECRLNVRGRNHYYFEHLGMKVSIITEHTI